VHCRYPHGSLFKGPGWVAGRWGQSTIGRGQGNRRWVAGRWGQRIDCGEGSRWVGIFDPGVGLVGAVKARRGGEGEAV
jgi:hypothetical protein